LQAAAAALMVDEAEVEAALHVVAAAGEVAVEAELAVQKVERRS
jgi:hypothetical protein